MQQIFFSYLSSDSINAIEKKDLVSKIEILKVKVIVENNTKSLFDQIYCLSENPTKLMDWNGKLNSQSIVVKNANILLDKRIAELEKSQAKAEHYSRNNNVEISCISHEILHNNREDKVVGICKDAGI